MKNGSCDGELSGERLRWRSTSSGTGVNKGLSVRSCEVSEGVVTGSGNWLVEGREEVPRIVCLVEGAIVETPCGGLQNDTHYVKS